jgi:predicted phage tail protein
MLTLIQVRNPLQPSVDRESRELEYTPEARLSNYLPNSGEGLVVSLNGRIVPESLLDETTPRDGDCIVTVPKVSGGGMLRTLAMVGVMAASIGAAVLTAGALAGPAGAWATASMTSLLSSVAAGAVGIAGNLLISAFLNTPSQKSNSPSYAFDGAHSLAQSGTVIPKGYGKFNWGGNIIASFIDVEGADQYINALACYGFGPGRSVADIQINGKPIIEFGNVTYQVRLGTNDQLPIPNFNRVVNGYPQDTQCLAGVPVIVPGTGTLTQILQVDIAFPSGIWVLTTDNNLIPGIIGYLVEYSVAGAADWKPVVQPAVTNDIVTFMLDGTPNPYPTWCAVATDMPPNSGVVYATDSGSHYPGEPYSATQSEMYVNADGSNYTTTRAVQGEWQLTVPGLNQVQVTQWAAGYIYFTACDQSPQYNRTNIYGLAPGKYDVRVTKWGSGRLNSLATYGDNWSPQIGQDMWIHSVNEVALLDLAYPNMILIGVRALATGQLSGSSLNITATITHGLRTLDNNILPGALQAFEEDNPACVAADMMLDGLYGGGQYPGIVAKNIDRFIDEWVAWAELNDELVDDGNGGSIRRHVFNGVFDNESNLWDQLNTVGRMSRAQLIPLGRDYGVFLDQPDVPCQIFSVGNIVQDSFNETWIELDARANQVEIQFADATRYWKQDNPLAYMDPANQDAGVAIKNVRIDGKGITIPAQAWHLARYKERCNQFLLRSGSFKCDVDAIASRPGNVVILQHDVPQWGWGGRTLPGSTASKAYLDRDDIPFESGTSYNLIVLFPAIQRYTGTVTAAAPVIDATGANTGTQLTLSSFDNASRVTRAVVVAAGIEYDCPITTTGVGLIVVQPIPGFTAAPGQSYTLYDTDVMEIATVTGISAVDGSLILGTPFSQAPQDFSTYFYGPVGTQKQVRITNIRKASEFRATIEWIDYDADVYTDGTPIIGETSAQSSSNPGVTNLTGKEVLQRVSGSYASYTALSWTNGPDTVGVGIYATYLGASPLIVLATTVATSSLITVTSTTGMAAGNPISGAGIPGGASIVTVNSGTSLTLSAGATASAAGVPVTVGLGARAGAPQMVARLTNQATSWQAQVVPGTVIEYTVVGFDVNDDYAGFNSAPSVTVEIEGVATNLLLGSTFASGFTYWNVTPRAGDALVPDLSNDGEATYTVANGALTAPQVLLYQPIPQAKWAVGDYLMLSSFFEDSCVSSGSPNVGSLEAVVKFFDASGTLISSAAATSALNGVAPLLNRYSSATTQIPTGTAFVTVTIEVAGGSLSIPSGSVLTFSHLLLEISNSTQTLPSLWADIDVQGMVLDYFQLGSSTGLRVQGSVLPSFTGNFGLSVSDTAVEVTWSDLVVQWPDEAFTSVADSTLGTGIGTAMGIQGLTASTTYYGWLYFDVVLAKVVPVVPTTPLGTIATGVPPIYLSSAFDPFADAACSQDGRVPLTPGGMQFMTTASGSSSETGGSGGIVGRFHRF